MTDLKDLKAIAERCKGHQPLRFMQSYGALYIRNDNGIVFDLHQNRSFPDFMAQNRDYADLVLAANPAAVLELIAEIERLETTKSALLKERQAHISQRDQVKAENEALRKDAKRYRFLRNQHWPVAYLAVVVNPKVSVKLGHDCPSGDRLDEQVDGAMKREASHD